MTLQQAERHRRVAAALQGIDSLRSHSLALSEANTSKAPEQSHDAGEFAHFVEIVLSSSKLR